MSGGGKQVVGGGGGIKQGEKTGGAGGCGGEIAGMVGLWGKERRMGNDREEKG